jgi:MFS-type transporter involved in bile tolerance (Atg22 family)
MDPAYPFWMGSALVIVATTLVFLFVKEPKEYETRSDIPSPGQALANLWTNFRSLFAEADKSALRILMAIFFWFVAYNAIEAFFTLYTQNHLGLPGEDGARLLGQLSLFFVLFALPAGYIGGRVGRRYTIMTGIVLMGSLMLSMYLLPKETLLIELTKLPVLGVVPVMGVILMATGASWALINVNSLPMVVDMTDNARIGTYTGLYYLFSTLAAIAGPNINGWIIALTGNNFSFVMVVGPIFMLLALVMMLGVKRGEAKKTAPAPNLY